MRIIMLKIILAFTTLVFMANVMAAGSWVKVRGKTEEAAFYSAQEKYGTKFVKRGSCTLKQSDGYYYCDALIAD
jgi:hypothetical protein